MSDYTVRKLDAQDFEALKALRLEALRLHPEAFSSDLERDAAFTDEQWRTRLAPGRTFGAWIGHVLVGMVAWIPGDSRKTAHTAQIGGMYVRAEARGTGAASALLNAAMRDASAHAEQLTLDVNADNIRAVRFYERHGFRTVGRIPHSMRVEGRLYDELVMWRVLSTSD